MSKSVKVYHAFARKSPAGWGRIILAVFIMPAAIGFIGVLSFCLRNFSFSYIPFFLGAISYTLVYPVFKKPFFGYVIGHELTHVLGIWLARGKVHGVKVGKNGGMVKTNKSNVWIALMPYFFPFYSFLVLAVYYLLSILWDMSSFFNFMVFLLGITWAFHIWMTLHIVKQNQPDIKYSGVLFSIVVIFTVNTIILALFLALISPDINIWRFICESFENIRNSYLWILKKLA